MSRYNATINQIINGSNDMHIGRKRTIYPYKELASSVLELGIKENDRFTYDDEWLHTLCGVAGVLPENYQRALDYFYGPVNKSLEA